MPPKKGSKQPNKAQQQQGKKKRTAKDKDEDALLDKLVAKNAIEHTATTLPLGSQMRALNAPIGRGATTNLKIEKVTAEEESRRLADASALKEAATHHLERLTVKEKGFQYSLHAAFSTAKELLLKALLVLAGKSQRVPGVEADLEEDGGVETALAVPELFRCGHENILTPELRNKAQEILLTLLRASLAGKYDRKLEVEIVGALSRCAPSCDETWDLGSEVYHSAGRYAQAVEALEVLANRSNGDAKRKIHIRIAKIKKDMQHVRGQMGDTELTCPICLSDCIRPCRPKKCPHIACEQCLLQHARVNNFCPMCRQPMGKAVSKVPELEQKEYYMDRLDRNRKDVVAWYNLAHIMDTVDIGPADAQRGVFKDLFDATMESGSLMSQGSMAVNFAIEALRLDPDVAEDLWSLFSLYYYFGIRKLPLEERRTFTHDLGEKLGKMTALQAATKALNSPYACKDAQPWFAMVMLMCRDYGGAIATGEFSVVVNGKTFNPLQLCQELLARSGNDRDMNVGLTTSAIGVTRLIYVMYLTDSIRNRKKIRVELGEEGRTVDAEDLYSPALTSLASYMKGYDFMYLAMGWRHTSQNFRNIVKKRPEFNVTQADLWGRALTTAGEHQEICDIANEMEEDEEALIDGKLVDKDDAIEMADNYTRAPDANMSEMGDALMNMLGEGDSSFLSGMGLKPEDVMKILRQASL